MSRPVRIVVIPERKRVTTVLLPVNVIKNVRSYRMGKVKSLYGGAAETCQVSALSGRFHSFT